MVVLISLEGAAAIVGKATGPPGADTGDSDAAAVSFVLHILLDPVLSPHPDFLCFAALGLLPTEVEALEDDAIHRVQHSKIGNGSGDLLCQLIIEPPCVSPEAADIFGTMLPLESLDAVQHSVQMVFFTGEVDKFPRQDSSIGTHDAAHRIGVESKVYCTNASFGGRGIGEQDLLLESKAQIVFAIVLLQRGRRQRTD